MNEVGGVMTGAIFFEERIENRTGRVRHVKGLENRGGKLVFTKR